MPEVHAPTGECQQRGGHPDCSLGACGTPEEDETSCSAAYNPCGSLSHRDGSPSLGSPPKGALEAGSESPGALVAHALYVCLAAAWHRVLLGERAFWCSNSSHPGSRRVTPPLFPSSPSSVSLLLIWTLQARISCEVSPCSCRFNLQNLLFNPLLPFPRAVPGSCNCSLVTGTNWDCKLVLFTAQF